MTGDLYVAKCLNKWQILMKFMIVILNARSMHDDPAL